MLKNGDKVRIKEFGPDVVLVKEGGGNNSVRPLASTKFRFGGRTIHYKTETGVHEWLGREAEYLSEGLLVLIGGFRGTKTLRISQLLPEQWAEVVSVPA